MGPSLSMVLCQPQFGDGGSFCSRSFLTRWGVVFELVLFRGPSAKQLPRVYASVRGQRDGCQHDADLVWQPEVPIS